MGYEALDEKCLLGEFYEYSRRRCNFNRIVSMSLNFANNHLHSSTLNFS